MKRDEVVETVLRDYVFADCRLGSHPSVRATVLWRRVDEVEVGESSVPRTMVPGGRIDLNSTGLVGLAFSKPYGAYLYEPGPLEIASDSTAIERGLLGHEFRGVLSVPLFDGRDVVGVLSLDSLSTGFFGDHHIQPANLLGVLLVYLRQAAPRSSTASSRALGEALRQVRQASGLSQDQVAATVGTTRIAISRAESGAQPPPPAILHAWCAALGLVATTNAARVEVIDVTPRLLEALRRDPHELANLSPDDFERFVAGRLDRLGYDVTLTGSTTQRDGGIDLIAVPKVRTVGAYLLAGQVKHHRVAARTGRVAVDRLLAWKDSPFRLALLATNTAFTADALWVAQLRENRAFLRLRGFEDMKRWIQDDFTSEQDWREIPESIELAPGIHVRIPKPTMQSFDRVWPQAPTKIT